MSITVELGDRVHARLYNAETGNVAIQEFVVSSVDSGVYGGGAIICDTKNGWTVELIEKSSENLRLPLTISEITAFDSESVSHHLIGKADSWMTTSGTQFPVKRIFRWVHDHV
jgi:nitrogen fixation protein